MRQINYGKMDEKSAACQDIVHKISAGKIVDRKGLARAKLQACRDFGLENPPKNSDILAAAGPSEKNAVVKVLRLKPVRSISGVSVITVMPKPYPCPKDEPCIYCPGGPKYNTPSAYTGKEPASARALQSNYDPRVQVSSRIKQLQDIGHDVDKVELIVFGGTLTAYPQDYLENFIVECLNAISGSGAKTIEEAQAAAENSRIRISDTVLETRPDCCREPQVDMMLRLGATRVELGVQTVYDDVYKLVNREHTVADVVDATRIARDAGFAIAYHMMPGLLGSDYSRDLEMFKTIFHDENFKPDALKIYPTLVMPGTKLHDIWRRGEYRPYSTDELVKLISEVKRLVPPWVRIQRVQRDIPRNLTSDGMERGDLRALIQRRMAKEGARCRCIRCREVGHAKYRYGVEPKPDDIELKVERFRASEGEEYFVSLEDVEQDILIGLLRLRDPSSKAHRPEARGESAALVRELHVFGPLVKVGEKAAGDDWQHRGWGEQLLREGERISRDDLDARKVIVLAGIGTRNYYRRFGYERDGPYMVKRLG